MFNKKRKTLLSVLILMIFTGSFLSAQNIDIEINWDTFNSNNYKGMLALPEKSDDTVEYISSENGKSEDGHVISGNKDEDDNSGISSFGSMGLSSSNSLSWSINTPQKGIYKLYIFPAVNDKPNKAVWSSDVTVEISGVDGKTVITPARGKGNVWYVCAISGDTGEVLEKQSFYPLRRMISGFTIDSLNGRAVPGADVMLVDKDTGNIMQDFSTRSDEDGFYVIYGFPMGRYSVIFGKEGYIQSDKTADFTLRDLPVSYNPPLSPVLGEAEYRVALTWGSKPGDLDAHITGPGDDGEGSFHISYQNMHEYNGRHTLDLDDTDSYGPETVTVKGIDSGTYEYYVHDFTNRKATEGAWDLGLSGAEVTVFRGGTQAAKFKVPEQEGNLWRVFKIDGSTGKIYASGDMEYIEIP